MVIIAWDEEFYNRFGKDSRWGILIFNIMRKFRNKIVIYLFIRDEDKMATRQARVII